MAENPYARIIKALGSGKTSGTYWISGRVLSTVPLTIDFNGAPLTGEELTLAYPLRYSKEEGERLKVGDSVALLPAADWQKFLVLCKVVSAS